MKTGEKEGWWKGEKEKQHPKGDGGLHFYITFLLLTTSVCYLDKLSQLLEPSGYLTKYKTSLLKDLREFFIYS